MLGVHVSVLVARHVLCGLVMDGTTVGLVLKLDMRLLLVVLVVVVTVGNVRLFMMHGVIVEDTGLVVMVDVLIVVDTLVVDDLVMNGGLNVGSSMLSALDAMAVAVIAVGSIAMLAVAVAVVAVCSIAVLAIGFSVAVAAAMRVVGFVMDRSDCLMNGLMDRLMDGLMDYFIVGNAKASCSTELGRELKGVGLLVVTVGSGKILDVAGEEVVRDIVLHLAAKENFGERKTNGVTELIEVLVIPLSLSIRNLVMHILTIDDKVVFNMEDEIPGVREGLGHLAELVKIGADCSLALFELVGDVVEDVAKVLNGVQDRVEGGVLELVNNTAKALPDMLGIAEALNTVRHFGLYGTGEQTLKNLAHTEEGEVDVRALHGLEVVHLLILLVVNLVKKLLPMVVEVEEEFLMVDHLGLAIKEHGSGLTEVFTGINPLTHTVVVETLTGVLEDVHAVNDERLVGLKKDLLGVEERLGHPLNLLVVVVVDLATVVKHVTDVGDGETELIDGLSGLLVGSVPEATHGVLEMLLNGVSIRHAVGNIGHAVEVEGTDKESLHEAGNFSVVVSVVSLDSDGNHSSSESTIHGLFKF